ACVYAGSQRSASVRRACPTTEHAPCGETSRSPPRAMKRVRAMTTGTMTAMSQAATCAPGAILKAPGATRTDGVMFAAAPVRLFAGAIARAITRSAAVCVAALSLAGCLDGGSDDSANAAEPPPTSPADSSSNSPPEIAGTPDGFVEAGGAYSFKPSASDPDDDFLEFKATNVP